MESLKINIRAQEEPQDLPGKSLEFTAAVIQEAETARGRTGISFTMKDDEGNVYHVRTTDRIILNGVAAALRGAMERFGDNPELP